MSAFPDRKTVSRPRNVGERSQTLTPEKSRRERGPSSMSSSSQDVSLGRALESGRRSDDRRPDYTTQGPPVKDKAVRGDRSEVHASGTSSGTGGSSSPAARAWNNKTSPLASRSSKEGYRAVPKPSKEKFSSPALRSTTQTFKPTKDETSSSASRSTKEEYYFPESKPTNEVVSPSGSKNPNERHWTPKDRASRGGTGLPRSKVVETEIFSEEQLSRPTLGSAVQRLSRPDHATVGYEVNLQTNCFEIKLDPSIQLYRYHVHVLAEPITARERKRAFDLFLKNAGFLNRLRAGGCHPVVATDYRSTLITTTRVGSQARKEDDRHQCIVPYYEAEEGAPKKTPSNHSHIFTVSFCQPLPLQKLIDYLGSTTGRALSKVNGSILHALSLVVARKPLKITDAAKTNNEHRFFPNTEPLAVLDGGLVALQGFQASVRMMGSRLFINVNPRTGIFYRENKNGTLFDLMNEFRNSSKGMEKMEEFVKGIRVSLSHLSSESGKMRMKTVSGLASGPALGANANEVSFRWNDKDITVADYYKQRYKISLEVSEAPVVNVGTFKNPTYIPPELCKVLPRQMANKLLSPDQQHKIATALQERKGDAIATIGKAAKPLAIGTQDWQGPNFFGLKVEPSVLTMKGRVMPAPAVQYSRKRFTPDFGSWNLKEDREFTTGAGIKQWTYTQIQSAGKDTRVKGLGDFITELRTSYAPTICEPAKSPQPLILSSTAPEHLFATLDKFMAGIRRNGVKTLLVILPDKRQTLFDCIKYLADVKHGIHTICIQAAKMQKHIKKSWYAATIAQKLNTKGGGVNHCLPKDELRGLLPTPTMIVGIDVTKPFPKGQANAATSIIGVVASKNADYAQYPASVRRQENPEKIPFDLQEMATERLKCWKKANNGVLPDRILIYRNSVTESHNAAIANEIKGIEDAIEAMYSGTRFPKTTIITISKSHHARFYPADNQAADGQSGNPKVGTVVDRVLTKQAPWDFYLQSHPGTPKSGTVCPTRYVVVKDDMSLGADGVQRLTNSMCYTSGRGTRTLSIVPPAHYANLVCERARCFVEASLIPSMGSGSESWTAGVHPELQNSMWYI